MRTRLFAVAFDLLPSTFVACSGDPAPLLEMRGRLGAIEFAGGVGRCLRVFQLGDYIIVARLDLAEPVVVFLWRRAIHGCCSMTAPGQAKTRRRMLSYKLRCGGRRDRWVGCVRRFVVLVGIRRLAQW